MRWVKGTSRLDTVEDPEVACLLLQAEVATVIPNAFLARTSLTALDLSAVSCVTEIGAAFLQHCSALTSLDLSGLTRLTRIGSHFLSDCRSLTAVDLSPLRNVTCIHYRFLYNCSLTSVDLSPLSRVTYIDDHFLAFTSLTELDLSPLSRVMQFGKFPANGCTSLRRIHLAGCSSAVYGRVRAGELTDLVVDTPPTRGSNKTQAA